MVAPRLTPMGIVIVLLLGITAAACFPAPGQQLVLLTQDGCVEANVMRQHLDAAIVKAGWSGDYAVINLATLARDDPRAGYPPPTVLHEGRDLYGMEAPLPAPPNPT